jgi:hypothetical protein
VRWLGVLALALASSLQASTPVIIDVTVIGRTAASLANLTAADFEVDFDGRPQAVRSVDIRPATAATEMAGAVGPVFETAPMPPSAVYRLAVDVSGPTTDAAIKVRLKRTDLDVLSARRTGIAPPVETSAPPAADGSIGDRLRDAVAKGRTSTGFPLATGHAVRRAPDGAQLTMEIAIDVPGATPGPISSVLGIVDARGTIRSTNQTLDRGNGSNPHHLDVALPLSPGAYKLRVAAADANGTLTSLELPMNAQLGQIGTLRASDLFRWTADASERRRVITDDTVPAGARILILGVELYPPAEGAPADLLLNMSLTPEGANTPATERIVTPELRDGALSGEAEFDVQRLAPGRYVARAIVLSGARRLGTVEAIVRR